MLENNVNPGDEKLLILPLGEESKKITQVISNDTARQIIELLADAPLCASDIAERLQSPLTTIAYNLENLENVGLIKIEKIKYSEKGREVKIYAPVRKLIVVVPEKTDRTSVADILRKYLGVILAAVSASGVIEILTRSVNKGARIMQATGDGLNEVSATTQPVPPMPAITSAPAVILNETVKSGYGEISTASTITPLPTAMSKSIASVVTPAPIAPVPAYDWNVNATAVPVTTLPPEAGIMSKEAAPGFLTGITDMILAHPGIMFLIGCLFVVMLLVIMDYRRRR